MRQPSFALALPVLLAVGCGAGEDTTWDPALALPAEVTTELEWLPAEPATQPQSLEGYSLATTETTQIYLWYADGNAPPSEERVCAGKTPPAYRCSFGTSIEDCKRKVQAYLDRWYAEMNVTFTFKKPTSGLYYTVVVSSDGQWCGQGQSVGGVAPINCSDLEGHTCYAFLCGSNAKTCATIIAQEQAHMVGLAHTNSRSDAMYPSVQAASDGFEKKDNSVVGNQCRMVQNSYQMMLDRLGRWPGGPKPDPFTENSGGAGGSGGGGMAGAGGTGGNGGAAGSGGSGGQGGVAGSGGSGGTGGQPGQGGRSGAGGGGGGSGGTGGSSGTGGSGGSPGTGGAPSTGGSGGSPSDDDDADSDESDDDIADDTPVGPERVVGAGCGFAGRPRDGGTVLALLTLAFAATRRRPRGRR